MLFLAPQKEFESPTFRLGGGRSILLSYWGVCISIVPKNYSAVNKNPAHFLPGASYTVRSGKGGRMRMGERTEPYIDLEDLLYDEDSGQPSQR